MKPTPSDVHVNAPLTNISVAFLQGAAAFIADRAFPLVPVAKQSDLYFKYTQADFFRNQVQKLAPGAEAAEAGYALSTTSYVCNVFGLKHVIPDQVRANSDSVLAPDQDGVEFLTQQALIKKEKDFATDFFTTGIWTTDVTGVASGAGTLQWNDALSKPVEDIRKGKRTVHSTTGYMPNKLVVGRQVYDALVDHPDILDRIKHGSSVGAPAMVTTNLLAQLFEVDEVLVMDAVENTANEGATATYAYVGGKKALLLYAAPRPGLRMPSAGYSFVWQGLTGLNNMGLVIYRRRRDEKHADEVEIGFAYDQHKVAADLGYFFNTIVA